LRFVAENKSALHNIKQQEEGGQIDGLICWVKLSGGGDHVVW
jgi:hypothetical protein